MNRQETTAHAALRIQMEQYVRELLQLDEKIKQLAGSWTGDWRGKSLEQVRRNLTGAIIRMRDTGEGLK